MAKKTANPLKKLVAKEAAMDKKGGKPTAAEKKLEKKLGKKA